jgi:hypothetical protein
MSSKAQDVLTGIGAAMFILMLVATHLTTSGKAVAWIGGKQATTVASGTNTQPAG